MVIVNGPSVPLPASNGSTTTVLPSTQRPQPRMRRTCACARRRSTPASRPTDDRGDPPRGLREVEYGRAGGQTEGGLPLGVGRRLGVRVGDVEERLRRNATDVQAGAADLSRLPRARCRDRAPRPGSPRCTRRDRRRARGRRSGARSSRAARETWWPGARGTPSRCWTKLAAFHPSMIRWSNPDDRFIIVRGTNALPSHTGRVCILFTPTTATSG